VLFAYGSRGKRHKFSRRPPPSPADGAVQEARLANIDLTVRSADPHGGANVDTDPGLLRY